MQGGQQSIFFDSDGNEPPCQCARLVHRLRDQVRHPVQRIRIDVVSFPRLLSQRAGDKGRARKMIAQVFVELVADAASFFLAHLHDGALQTSSLRRIDAGPDHVPNPAGVILNHIVRLRDQKAVAPISFTSAPPK